MCTNHVDKIWGNFNYQLRRYFYEITILLSKGVITLVKEPLHCYSSLPIFGTKGTQFSVIFCYNNRSLLESRACLPTQSFCGLRIIQKSRQRQVCGQQIFLAVTISWCIWWFSSWVVPTFTWLRISKLSNPSLPNITF